MALKTTKLRDAITFALVVGATTAGTALAQSPVAPQEGATTLDRIQVTGSRIRQAEIETAQPVTFVTREDIERQGFQSVSDILQNVSAFGAPPISRASPLSAGELAGGTYISLRNLGPTRSLVLVNGRRLGVSTSGWADISAIPAAAVERIEVLKDGASSIYGSDAIAGVINIITRSNFEGARASAYYGQYGEGDGGITNGDFVMGFTGDRGSLTLAAEWRKEDSIPATARPYSAFPRSSSHPTDNWTPVGEFGGFVTSAERPVPGVAAGTRVVLREGGDPRNPADYRAQNLNTGSCAPAAGATLDGCVVGSTADKSNTNEQTDLRTGLEARALYVDGVYDFTDTVRFRTNFLYANRVTDRRVAGYPMQASQFAGVGISPDSYFNPYATEIPNWWRRTWEVPRDSASDHTSYRFSAALEGSLEFADRFFDWDVSYLHNNNRVVNTSFGNLNLANLRAAVGPSFLNAQGQVVCGTPGATVTGCVPFSPMLPFGTVAPGGLTDNAALQNFLFQQEKATGETTTEVFAANFAGAIVDLPAGDLGFAVGVESRKESGSYIPDALAVSGGSTNLAAGPTGGSYRVNEAYVELEVPILADMPGAQELALNLASRYSDFDTFGETTNNKLGLRWRPMDTLLVRATIADGFRAPTISDLFSGGSQTFTNYTDPCDTQFGSSANNASTRANCRADLGALADTYRQITQGGAQAGAPNAQTSVPFTSGGNPLLAPEESTSQTMGFVWSPTFAEGLSIGLDWWKVRIENTIVADSPSVILSDCYVLGIQSRCDSSLFTRDAGTGVPTVTFGSRNAGFRKIEGYDLDVGYRMGTDYGNFGIRSTTTYTARDFLVATNDPQFATSAVGFTSTFRVRSNNTLSWDMGDFGASWTARYYSSMKEGCTYAIANIAGEPVLEPHLECNEITYAPSGALLANGEPASSISRRKRTGSTTFNDLQFRYNAPWDATIAIGANNVFDRVGPVMYTQPSANVSYYGGFDIGRFLYMRYTQRF